MSTDLPDLPVPPMRVHSTVVFPYGDDHIGLFVADENDQGFPILLDREAADAVATNLLDMLMQVGVDILAPGGEA